MFAFLSLFFFSCRRERVTIGVFVDSQVGRFASTELERYLNRMYTDVDFAVVQNGKDKEQANIQLVLPERAQALGMKSIPTKAESFHIVQKNNTLYLLACDERGLLNGVYALLESLGCGLYISGDVLPKPTQWKGFAGWEMQDEPLFKKRFLFNWHNFLSGCSGWNLTDWQQWIEQANKMRYNAVMVHAYGNNPMFSFEYLGEKKETGYLNNSASGRDWGNQHVNDVRRMVGGELFDAAVLGAKASLASKEKKDAEATALMQSVFQYAEDRGTEVIFALDFDTFSANPQNIIAKLPQEAVFNLKGYLTPNPEHPAGYNYYKQIVQSLVDTYPQVDELTVWHRRAGVITSLGSIWMEFSAQQFPETWKTEYQNILKANPQLEDNLASSSMFAFSKVIVALQKARDEVKPGLRLSSGSWSFKYLPYADVFFPKDIPLLPLDYRIVFDQKPIKQMIADAGSHRDIHPIVWAHHDDHRYIGRPYTPWDHFADRLQETHASGFGIIHWTTHPLDLYFTSSARQVWKQSKNEDLRTTTNHYVKKFLGTESSVLSRYYYDWITEGPMFGRETTDHFMDLGGQKQRHSLKDWMQLLEEAKARLALINAEPSLSTSDYLMYQRDMEAFYLMFFHNQQLFDKAYELQQKGAYAQAIAVLEQTNPDEVIQKYVDATQRIGFSSGEKAIVFSMNTRWKVDFINFAQQLGIEPVRYRFAPTQHDSLAQQPGRFSYFIDDEKQWYRCLWNNELPEETFVVKEGDSYLKVNDLFEFDIVSMHGQSIPEFAEVELKLEVEGESVVVDVKNGGSQKIDNISNCLVSCNKGTLQVQNGGGKPVFISEIVVLPN